MLFSLNLCLEVAVSPLVAESAGDLGRGAIAGALLAGAAFLAGAAVLRPSLAAIFGVCAVLAALALEAVWLGLAPPAGASFLPAAKGLFAAAGLIFVSSAVATIRETGYFRTAFLIAALAIAAIGVLDWALADGAAGLLRLGLIASAAGALAALAFGVLRGDLSALLLLPGAALALAAPFAANMAGASGAFALAPQGLFAIGVLCASFAAMAQPARAPAPEIAADSASELARAADEAPATTETRLAEILDYAGVAVWDWSKGAARQTSAFGEILGVRGEDALTPAKLRGLIRAEDADRFAAQVYGAARDDGRFDETFRLRNAGAIRMRGARAVDRAGDLERVVLFVERRAAETTMREEAPADGAAKRDGETKDQPSRLFQIGGERRDLR